jgi:TP901 family phage tail tape measure protein
MAVGVNIVSQFDAKGITKAIRDFKQLEGAGAKATYGLRTLDKAAVNIAKNLAKAGLAAGVLGGYAVKQFASFDDAMTQSTAIMGNLSNDMKNKMADAARQMARESTFSATEAAKSFYFLASAGLDAEASIQALPKVTKFAQAGMFDMALATDLLTDAQSALGLTIRDDAVANMRNMTRVSDVLVKANVLANASVQQFSEALTNKAGPAMKSVGMDIEEGVAVLAALADQGIKGAEAGTQFGIALRDLQTKSIENRKEFEALGVKVFDSSGQLNNMGEIVKQLEKGLGGMTDEQKKVTLSQMGFADRSVSVILALLGQGDAIVRYEEELRKAAGTTDEVADKQLDSLTSQMKLAMNAINDVAITIGEKLAPYVRGLAVFIQDLSKVIGKEGFGAGLAFTRDRIFEVIGNMGTMGNVILGLTAAFVALRLVAMAATVAQVAFGVALMANPIGIVVAAIIALGVTLAALYLKFEPVRTVINAIGKALVKTFQEIAEKVMNYFIIQINAVLVGINAMIWAANKLGANIEPIGYIALKSFGDTADAAHQAAVDVNALRKQFAGLREDRNLEGTYKQIQSVTRAVRETKTETEKTPPFGGGAAKTIEKVKEKLQKYIDAMLGLNSAQKAARDSAKGVLKANTDLANANMKLAEAQEYFNRIISGYGAGSREATDQQVELQKAQRRVERAGYGVEESLFAIEKAERDLAEVRLDPNSSAMAIREAEIKLAEAKLSVADATDSQRDATENLSVAERRLDEIINGAREDSETYKTALDRLNDAKKAQADATDAVTEAYERQRDALIKLREAEEKLQEVRQKTSAGVQARGNAILNTPLGIQAPSAGAEGINAWDWDIYSGIIPFAKGGVVTSPTLGLIGEAGPEAVIPLSDMGAMGGMNIVVNINAGMGTDPAALGDEIVNVLQRYNRRNGALPLKVA